MSTLKADTLTTKSDNTNISITGAGTGKVALGDGTLIFPDADGSANQPIITNGSAALSFATLPIAGGGTGSTSTTYCNLTSNVTGTMPVANGGTGATTLTANSALLGNGTSALQAIAPGSSGNVLTSDGSTWASVAAAGGGAWGVKTSGTFSGVAAFAVTGITKYTEFYFFNFHRDSGSGNVQFRTSGDNGSSYDSGSTDYDYVRNQLGSGSTNPEVFNSGSGQSSINTHGAPYPTGDSSDAWIHVRLPNPTAQLWNILLWDMWHNDAEDSSPMFIRNGIGQRQGVYSPDADIDAIQVTLTDGSNMSGSYVVVELD